MAALIQVCTLPFCAESPRYSLIVKGRHEQAEKDLKRLRGKEDVSEELEVISEEAAAAKAVRKVLLLTEG